MRQNPSPMGQPLFRLLLINALAGALAAVVVVSGLLLADVGALGTIVFSSSEPVVPIALMTAGFVVTLSSAAMGVAVMRLGRSEGAGGGGGGHLRPIPIRTGSGRSR